MNLERLYLENYKQFRGALELEPPEGAIGVVGANGSGKTTIFEAILWAFFGPGAGGDRFKNELIPWSGGTTKDRSVVRVTLASDGGSCTVERTLQSGKAQARVLSGSGEELVGGPREVASWVQENLLGMDRAAFESTFFARQKELEFFSGVTGVSRQREIARLLGISRVENARSLLNEDGREARRHANALEARLDEEGYERLKEERESTRAEREGLEEGLERARRELSGSESDLEAARQERKRLEESYREHHRLASGLQEAKAERQRAGDRQSSLRGRLEEIRGEEKEIERLSPRLDRMPELDGELRRLEEARRKSERREAARSELARARRRVAEAIHRASETLEALDDPGEEPLPGWRAALDAEDGTERMREAGRVLEAAPEALRDAEESYRRLEELQRLANRIKEQEAATEQARSRLGEVDSELAGITGGEDLDELSGRLREEREELGRRVSSLRGAAEADERQAENMDEARRVVEEAGSGGECPTCKRGFHSEDEHLEAVQTLESEAAAFRSRAEEAGSEAGRLEEKATELSGKLDDTERRQNEAAKLKERRLKLSTRLESAEEELGHDRERLEGLEDQPSDTPPTSEEIQSSWERVERLRRLRDSESRVSSFIEAHGEAESSAAELEEELSGLTEVLYDASEHERLAQEKSELEGIRGRVQTMRDRASSRPEVERQLEEAGESEKAAAGKASELEATLSELAFDEEAYREAGEWLRRAEERREELRERREELRERCIELDNRLQTVSESIRRHEEARKEADEQAALATRLERMNGLFKEFYGELSSRARPALQAEAGEMVRALTDGRYERVGFDESYGIQLFDGLSEAYGIERFSGGEADIVSLSARVALSKMISSRANDPLGFIVLDEVFGALDADRRYNVLQALDRLKRFFAQTFIISHVGEVQESALLDELWTVEEDDLGRSTVRTTERGLGSV